ncbi:zinc finger protein 593 homolog [Nasonia vitripennis]|uniref:Zinc finger protein 593 homolog n=1 Tax=Nasonia vitripennis TaxID=7425 RepID=A0A7M7LV98_NASVI|nr:zinc finger protein 593 homolog [Nasonia vitripennis]
MVYRRKKHHKENLHIKKAHRTKRRTKDLDEIDADLKEENAIKLINQEVDFDKPGAAQNYCIHCARYFVDQKALHDHFKTKVHKRRLKALEEEPYTVEDSERAAGKGNFVQPKKRKIETIASEEDINKEAKVMKVDDEAE